jgi:hypothetical protein
MVQLRVIRGLLPSRVVLEVAWQFVTLNPNQQPHMYALIAHITALLDFQRRRVGFDTLIGSQ